MYLSFNDFINEEIKHIKKNRKNDFHEYERLRKKFIRDFSAETIQGMKVEDFVIGGGSKTSFCYRLERELDLLGRILGATAIKFGIYFSDDENGYVVAKKWSDTENVDEALIKIKAAIVELIKGDLSTKEIQKNPLSPMMKRKVLFIYHPDKYINIFSDEHLSYFATLLGVTTRATSKVEVGFELQKALVSKKNAMEAFKKEPVFLFTEALYEYFGYPKHGEFELPPLGLAVKNINIFPTKKRKIYKPDYDELMKNRKLIGQRGELLVFEYEKNKLKHRGQDQNCVKHISLRDDSKGYDIESLDEKGNVILIEVKATACGESYRSFYLTENELKASKELDNYYLYRVFHTLSKNPVLRQFKSPDFNKNFELTALQYRVQDLGLSPVTYDNFS